MTEEIIMYLGNYCLRVSPLPYTKHDIGDYYLHRKLLFT